jgi:hypothetical protein
MMLRTAVALAIVSVIHALPARAQTHPGLAFDETVHSARGGTQTDTSTAVMHFTVSRGNIRIDVDRPITGTSNLPTGVGRTAMLLTDSGGTITYLNIDQKQYISIKPGAMMEGMRKMMETMGGKIVIDTSTTKLSLDSLGVGPVVEGRSTVHYRLRTSLHLSVEMMGNTSSVEEESVQDIYSAPDLKDLADLAVSLNRLGDIGRTVGLAPEFMERAKELQRKIVGLPVRLTKVETIKTGGQTRRSTEDALVSNVRHIEVPDSAFVIPAGYTQIAAPRLPSVDR